MRRCANCSHVDEKDGEGEERRGEWTEVGCMRRTLASFPSLSFWRRERIQRRRRFSPYTQWNRTTSRTSHPKMLSARKIVSGDMAVMLPPTNATTA